jgi:DNA-binding transcriptional regulator LsrR (DeoR family)
VEVVKRYLLHRIHLDNAISQKDISMKLVATLAATAMLAFVATGSMAQTATTTTKPATTATTDKAPTDKKAISKACSTQADAKGLHGKERKKFRNECKKNGGKAQ